MLEVLYHLARFGGARISPAPAAGAAKNVEFFCLSVCLSDRHTFEGQSLCARFRHESVGVLEYRNDFDAVGQGRFVVVHLCSSFSDCCQLAIPLNAEVQKRQKLGFFANRGRQDKPIETKFGP